MWTPDGEVYLGHFNSSEKAGQAYDRAAICLKGFEEAVKDGLNFRSTTYHQERDILEESDFGNIVSQLQKMGVKGSGDLVLK